MSKNVTKTDDGLFTTTLTYIEIKLLYVGVIPFVAYDHDPMIPDDEFLWIHQEETGNDTEPELDPIPCKILSCIQFLPNLFILTLKPDEIDFDLSLEIEQIKAKIERKPSTLRTQAMIDPTSFN